MKKIISLLLVVVMLCSLVGCSNSSAPTTTGSNDSSEAVELLFWGHQENAINSSFERIGEEFHKLNPDITIKFEFFPYDEYEAKVLASLSSKTGGADLYELWGGWGVDFCSTGALAQMPDDLAKTIMDDAYPSTYGALEYDGHLYGLPMEFNAESGAMLVNLNLLNEAGISIPTTWDDLIADAKKIKQGEGEAMTVKGFDFVGWDSIPYTFTAMILSQGDNYLNEDGSFNFTSDAAKKAFTELTDLVLKDNVTNLVGLTGGDSMENYQLLFADQVAFAPRGAWTVAEGEHTFGLKFDEDFTYAPMPWYGDKVAFCNETGWSLAANGNSAKQEAAFKFLQYFFSDEVLMSHDIASGFIPSKRSVAEDPALLEAMPFLSPLVGILGNSQFIGYFNTDVFKEILNNAFTDYCSGGVYSSIDEALTDIENQCNDNLR